MIGRSAGSMAETMSRLGSPESTISRWTGTEHSASSSARVLGNRLTLGVGRGALDRVEQVDSRAGLSVASAFATAIFWVERAVVGDDGDRVYAVEVPVLDEGGRRTARCG